MCEWVNRRGTCKAAFELLRDSILCRRDGPIAKAWDVVGWWEARRLPFNLIVGSAGIFTCVIVGVIGAASAILFHSDFGMPDPPLFALFGMIIYGVVANVCFTGGWIAELFIRKVWPQRRIVSPV